MKKILILLLLLGVVSVSNGQWSFQVSNTTNTLWDVSFVNANKGWAVGDNGTIIHTTNGGDMWTFQNSGTVERLSSVCFPSQNVGYIVGGMSGDIILKSVDGGSTWNNQSIGLSKGLVDCIFIDNDTGYVVTGFYNGTYSILKTTDGGINWIDLNITDTVLIQHIHFINSNIGFAVGYSAPMYTCFPYIIKTIDGGQNWLNVTPNIPNHLLESVQMVDENTVYVIGDTNSIGPNPGRVLKTNDGGLNWVSYSLPDYLFCAFFQNENIGYAPGLWKVYHTDNGGLNWGEQSSDSVPPIAHLKNSIIFPTPDTGYIVGYAGTILKTVNGGGIVGIDEIPNNHNELYIFPNPTTGITNINYEFEVKEDVSISINNINGQEIKVVPLGRKKSGNYKLNCEDFSPGIYFITLKSESGILTEKLIVE